MRGILSIRSLAVAATLLVAGTAHGQAGAGTGAKPAAFGFAAGSFSGTYKQSSQNSQLEQSDTSEPIDVTGIIASLNATVFGARADLGFGSYRGKGDTYLTSRQDLTLDVAPHLLPVTWVSPTIGFIQQKQVSDRSRDDAPVALIDQTRTLRVGLKSDTVPAQVGNHGLSLCLSLQYLTSGESQANFGNETAVAIGYVYKSGTFAAGIRAGMQRTYLNASRTTSETDDLGAEIDVKRQSRGTLDGNVVTLFVSF